MLPSNLCQLSREKEQTRSSVSGEAGRAAERNGDEKDHVDVEEERRDLFPGDRETERQSHVPLMDEQADIDDNESYDTIARLKSPKV